MLGRLVCVMERIESRLSAGAWPKTTAQFAKYVGRDVRTVQGWIDAGRLKANTRVRPAMITQAQAAEFMEGGRR